MSAVDNITKYIRKVDPYGLADPFELVFDLKDHMNETTPYAVEEDELLMFVEDYYFDHGDLNPPDLARAIVRRFGLE